MAKWKKVLAYILGAVLVLVASAVLFLSMHPIYPGEYTAAPLSARIVNSETGEPVSGAIVVAVYVMTGLSGRLNTPLHYEETVTNENGEFGFGGFVNKPIPYDRVSRATPLGNRDPRLYAFAKGYLPAMYQRDDFFPSRWKESYRKSKGSM